MEGIKVETPAISPLKFKRSLSKDAGVELATKHRPSQGEHPRWLLPLTSTPNLSKPLCPYYITHTKVNDMVAGHYTHIAQCDDPSQNTKGGMFLNLCYRLFLFTTCDGNVFL